MPFSSAAARVLVTFACALALPVAAQAAVGQSVAVPKQSAAATIEQCVTAVNQAERSATFVGEMTATPATAHMQMRIEVLEKLPKDASFHTVLAPGLGVWRVAAAGVKVYKYLKQVTNLSAPAVYRGAVHFRWLNAKGRQIKSLELRTPRCEEPAPPQGS